MTHPTTRLSVVSDDAVYSGRREHILFSQTSEAFQDSFISLLTVSTDLLLQMTSQIGQHAVVIKERVIDIDKEDD